MTYTYRGTQHVDPDPTPHKSCGTRAGYERHRRNKETACTPCLDANAKYAAQRRGGNHTGQRRRLKVECGTAQGYRYHYTRGDKNPCLPCRFARSEFDREYRARKKANAA